VTACLLNSINVQKKCLILKSSEGVPTSELVIVVIQRDGAFIFLSIGPLFVEIGSFVSLLSLMEEVRYFIQSL